MRRAGRIRALYTDARRRGAAFDNLHFLPTAPPPAELCVSSFQSHNLHAPMCMFTSHLASHGQELCTQMQGYEFTFTTNLVHLLKDLLSDMHAAGGGATWCARGSG